MCSVPSGEGIDSFIVISIPAPEETRLFRSSTKSIGLPLGSTKIATTGLYASGMLRRSQMTGDALSSLPVPVSCGRLAVTGVVSGQAATWQVCNITRPSVDFTKSVYDGGGPRLIQALMSLICAALRQELPEHPNGICPPDPPTAPCVPSTL